jgi:hypothetical protein
VTIGAVETSARSTSPKLTPLPDAPAPEDARDLIFNPSAEEMRPMPVRRPPPPPPVSTADILTQLAQVRPKAEEPAEPMLPVIAEADHKAMIDEVLREILADPDAAFRTVAVLYQDFLVRCRIRRVPGEPLTLADFRRRFAVARAGVDTTRDGEEGWSQAVELSASLPDDLQGVFLVLARAAMTGAPCPSDATIARVYGSHSPSRARRLLAYFEERGLFVVRTDFRNRRILASPDLGCETAPGDPAGAEEPMEIVRTAAN